MFDGASLYNLLQGWGRGEPCEDSARPVARPNASDRLQPRLPDQMGLGHMMRTGYGRTRRIVPRENCEIVPRLSVGQVQHLLTKLREEGQVHLVGRTRSARWYCGPETAPDGSG